MSSHHIVKDNQEPALFLNQSGEVDFERIRQLLEWSPTVIVPASSALYYAKYGIKLDILIGRSEDHHFYNESLNHQLPFQYISLKPGETALQRAIAYLETHHYKALNIVDKFTEELQITLLRDRYNLNMVVFDHYLKWHLVEKKFKKWKRKDEKILLMGANSNLEMVNLRREGENEYKVTNDGMVIIGTDRFLWLGEHI